VESGGGCAVGVASKEQTGSEAATKKYRQLMENFLASARLNATQLFHFPVKVKLN